MTQKQLAIRRVLESSPIAKQTYTIIYNEVYKGLTGIPNWYKESNGLDLVDSLRNYENNFINSFDRLELQN